MSPATGPAGPPIEEPRKLIGVTPAVAASNRSALLGALEAAFPVRFQGRAQLGDLAGLDGQLVLGPPYPEEPSGDEDNPTDDCPRLVLLAQSEGSGEHSAEVEFAEDTRVARPLRGRKLTEAIVTIPVNRGPRGSDSVLAACNGRPVWWSRADAAWEHFSSWVPAEVGEDEVLRDQLSVGRSMGLVPLIHFLRHVCGELNWDEQPLRASFVIDDPNLHWPSYGYLDYPEMVAHANRHGYHVGFAMIPLDGWLTNRRAASLVRENPAALSLLMHGNDHVSDELGRVNRDRDAEMMLAQALHRTLAFERRSGLRVQRVMVPPHEACSMTALKAMSRLGFDAACIGRRHPWKDHEPQSSLPRWPLMKWHPTDMIDGALPILPRYMIDRPREEVLLRALLGQPLILFGHHWDFADGLDVLSEAASYINGLGDVRWGSAVSIARHSFLARREGETLIVQMHSRRVTLDIPEDVSVLRVTTPNAWGERSSRLLAYGASHAALTRDDSGWISGPLRVLSGAKLELELVPERAVDAARVGTRSLAAWPATRRALVEARDRMLPLRRRLSRM